MKNSKAEKAYNFSTGLANEGEIKKAIKIITKYGNKKIIILKCSSSYPATAEDSNLKNIIYLKKKFKYPVGLSDHTIGNAAAISAVSLGACMVEKHFNLNDKKKTIDSFFSSSNIEFKNMIKDIRFTEKALGKYNYKLSKGSIANLKSKRSIYISKNIEKGAVISKENVKIVRPSLGLHPKFLKKLLVKK